MFLFLITLHFLGAFLVVGGLAAEIQARRAVAMGAAPAGTGAMLHGIGLSLILLTGIGLLTFVYHGEGYGSLWFWGKLTIWLLLGGILALIRRKPRLWKLWWVLVPVLATAAGVLGSYKPCCL